MSGPRLLACWVPGLDRRRINDQETPYVNSLLKAYPSLRLRTFPGPEYLSTAITGVWPNAHGFWHVQMRNGHPTPAWWQRLVDAAPERLTTAAQCLAHELTGTVSLPTIPPIRRRRFTIRHLRFFRRADLRDLLATLGAIPSVFSHLGPARCSYRFGDDFEAGLALPDGVGTGRVPLEFLHAHGLDLKQHWELETPQQRRAAYRAMDEWLEALHRRCADRGVTFALIVPHGQEPVVGAIDLRAAMRAERIGPEACTWMLEPGRVRFWCHTDRARDAVTRLLAQVPHGTALSWKDWARFGFELPDARSGEFYFFPDPGFLVFPHDFYHPLVNAVQGWRKAHMRRRLRDPKPVGLHGYLPDHPSSEGFLCVADAGYEPLGGQMPLVDVAPTILGLLKEPAAPFMTGTPRLIPR
jgi:hypothetical protein